MTQPSVNSGLPFARPAKAATLNIPYASNFIPP